VQVVHDGVTASTGDQPPIHGYGHVPAASAPGTATMNALSTSFIVAIANNTGYGEIAEAFVAVLDH
jgi:hypothetical protein